MIKIVSDTTTGLTRELADKYDIDLVPQRVIFGAETLRDGIDISNEVFLQRLKMSKLFPTTSQPPAGDFVEIFKRHLDAGHEVLCITVSSLLSGTYNSAEAAKQQLGSDRIRLIDSKHIATAEALIVIEAARMARAGRPMAEIVARTEKLITGMRLDFVLDTLENLVRGGRATRIQGAVGALLNIKLLLTIEDGRIEQLEKVRTKAKAVGRLREIVDAAVKGKPGAMVGVVHTGLHAEAEALAREFRAAYNLDECLVLAAPPAIAAHAGAGALGAAYYAEN